MNEHNPIDIEAQAKDEAAKKQTRNTVRISEDSDFIWLMSNRRGRRIVWRQLSEAGVFHTTFNTNAMQMAFNEGCKNGALKLLADVHRLCPLQYIKMIEEAQDDNRTSSARSGD